MSDYIYKYTLVEMVEKSGVVKERFPIVEDQVAFDMSGRIFEQSITFDAGSGRTLTISGEHLDVVLDKYIEMPTCPTRSPYIFSRNDGKTLEDRETIIRRFQAYQNAKEQENEEMER